MIKHNRQYSSEEYRCVAVDSYYLDVAHDDVDDRPVDNDDFVVVDDDHCSGLA